MEKKKDNSIPNAVQEEQILLASIGTSIQSQTAYESAVIRQATHKDVPMLTGQGFPDLSSLIPRNGASTYIPHVLSTLSKVRHQMQSLNLAEDNSPEAHMIQMKYQILMSFLLNHTQVSMEDIRHDDNQEILSEKKRKRNLLYQTSSHLASADGDHRTATIQKDIDLFKKNPTSGNDSILLPSTGPQALEYIKRHFAVGYDDSVPILSTSKSASFGKQAVQSRNESIRISRQKASSQKRKGNIMDMKRTLTEEGGEEWIDPVDLWNKREARREKRRLKKESTNNKRLKDEEEEEGENEFEEDNVIVPLKPLVSKRMKRLGKNKEGRRKSVDDWTKEPAPSSESVAEIGSVVYCSICERSISVPMKDGNVDVDLDEYLCRHMSTCRGITNNLRSSRSGGGKRQVSWDPAVNTNTHHQHEDMNCVKGEDEDTMGGDPIHETNVDQTEEEPIFEREISIDDWDENNYEDRVDEWIEVTLKQMKKSLAEEEKPMPVMFPGGLFVPSWVNKKLFSYQRTGLRWMWELYQQGAGGIVGDEMGLGKTVQVSAFLGAMTASRKIKSVLIICPATMMAHWLNELALWAPSLRRIMMHKSAGNGDDNRKISKQLLNKMDKWLRRSRTDRLYEAIDENDFENNDPDIFCGTAYAFVTTYDSIRLDSETWQNHDWSIVILDEGQKIRNPDADVTLACKRLKTPHRYLLSGSPIQNDLMELWSLFDFVFPGRLGTLPAFEAEFSDVIRKGGYSNASPMQVALAYRCALVLKDIINPYLLRRHKKDVKEMSLLPGKTEQVLFCRLSKRQRILYEAYLQSDAVKNAVRGAGQIFKPIIILRKICNHPDLVCSGDQESLESFARNGFDDVNDSDSSGSDDECQLSDKDDMNGVESLVERAGKFEVLAKILPLWFSQGHRVLIFSQWKKTLNIIQRFVTEMGWNMMRMDGSTNVGSRQTMVDRFNADPSIFGMLMTTRTGGVGLNLTGANRIILYDPDWNPQTDAQARERSWRYGQSKAVTIYRLIVAGTIEEKIYHRQIFKTALTNQILQDPRQRRLFTQKDLRDLFTLKPDLGTSSNNGDTADFTRGVGVIPNDSALRITGSDDNNDTLDVVFKCKGLAGVFDHDTVDESSAAQKSLADIEMDEKAKKVAANAARAIASSSVGTENFTPTWTGSKATEIKRFGGVQKAPSAFDNRSGSERSDGENRFGNYVGLSSQSASFMSSSSLLDNLRNRTESVSMASKGPLSMVSTMEQDLRNRLKKFIQSLRIGATTDQLVAEFREEQSQDANVFRNALQFVATLSHGRWHLK